MNVIVEQKFVFSFFAVFSESALSEWVEQFIFVVSPDRHQLANRIRGVGSRIVTQGPRYETSQMLRCRFHIKKLSINDAVCGATHQQRGGVTERLVIEIAAVAE